MTTTNVAKSIAAARPAEIKPPQSEAVTLKAICTELKLDPRLAREEPRIAVRDAKEFPDLAMARTPHTAWEWPKGSPAEQQARAALKV